MPMPPLAVASAGAHLRGARLRRSALAAATDPGGSTNAEAEPPPGIDEPQAARRSSSIEDSLTSTHDIFDLVDVSKDGRINKRELIKAVRQNASVAALFGSRATIRQEDGSGTRTEMVFQALDKVGDLEITRGEFLRWYSDPAKVQRVTEAATKLTRAAQPSEPPAMEPAALPGPLAPLGPLAPPAAAPRARPGEMCVAARPGVG